MVTNSAVTEVKKARIMNYIKSNDTGIHGVMEMVPSIMIAKDNIIKQLDRSQR